MGRGKRKRKRNSKPKKDESGLENDVASKTSHATPEVKVLPPFERKAVGQYTPAELKQLEDLLGSSPSAGQTCTGVARLMEIGDDRSAYLKMREYRGRTQTPDRRLLIDCTNLQDVLKHGKGPLVAVCLDGDESSQWISCVLGFLHPRLILLQVRLCLLPISARKANLIVARAFPLQPVVLEDNVTIDHTATSLLHLFPDINMMAGDFPEMKMVYLNACTESLVGVDGRVKCSIDGECPQYPCCRVAIAML